MTIEQATVKILAHLNLRNEIAIDCIDLAIVSVIGFAAVRRIVNSSGDIFAKDDDLRQLLDEIEHMNINEMIKDFLKDE